MRLNLKWMTMKILFLKNILQRRTMTKSIKVIYRIFNDNLMQTLKGACNTENEEFKYDPNLSPVHPIFGKKLTLFTMMWTR